jgi:hypothetical protein
MASYRERAYRVRDTNGALALLFGVGLFMVTGYALLDAQRIAWNGAEATGTVIAVEKRRGTRSPLDTAVYRYTDRDGRRFTARQNVKVPWRTVREGEKVVVLYDVDAPQRSIIEAFGGRFGDLPLFLISLVLIILGTRALIRDREDQAG